jgi:hypothetical protein
MHDIASQSIFSNSNAIMPNSGVSGKQEIYHTARSECGFKNAKSYRLDIPGANGMLGIMGVC